MAQEPGNRQADSTVNINPRVRADSRGLRDKGDLLARTADLRVDTTLVQIPVVVTTADSGRLVTGLDRENFQVFEDNVEQSIAAVSDEDLPLSVGIVFDTSRSMAGDKAQRARDAVNEFTKTANAEDEFFTVTFNNRPAVLVPWTFDSSRIGSKLISAKPKGTTALLDALLLAMKQMKKAQNSRRALLIISDGGDNSSRHTETEVRRAVREGNVQIYAIGIYDFTLRWQTPEEVNGPRLLRELTSSTGGRNFDIENLADLPDVASRIGRELRNQYVISYRPTNTSRDGKYRKVEVRLVSTNPLGKLRVQFRGGYHAPRD